MAEFIAQDGLTDGVLRRVERGESFIVTRGGIPIGELAPVRRKRFVSADAVLAVFRNAPSIDATRFRADVDANADQTFEPRA